MEPTTHLIKRFTWYTELQVRDMLVFPGITTEQLQDLRVACIEETKRRKALPNEFVQCPRCKGYHSEKANNDSLCEKCEQEVHVMEFDKTYTK